MEYPADCNLSADNEKRSKFTPCDHAGPCGKGCPCVTDLVHCEKACACPPVRSHHPTPSPCHPIYASESRGTVVIVGLPSTMEGM